MKEQINGSCCQETANSTMDGHKEASKEQSFDGIVVNGNSHDVHMEEQS